MGDFLRGLPSTICLLGDTVRTELALALASDDIPEIRRRLLKSDEAIGFIIEEAKAAQAETDASDA